MRKFRLPRKEKKRFKKAYYRKWLNDWFKGYYRQSNYSYYKKFGDALPF